MESAMPAGVSRDDSNETENAAQWGRPMTLDDFAPPHGTLGRPLTADDYAPPHQVAGRPLTLDDFAPRHLPPISPPKPVVDTPVDDSSFAVDETASQQTDPHTMNVVDEDVVSDLQRELVVTQELQLDHAVWTTESMSSNMTLRVDSLPPAHRLSSVNRMVTIARPDMIKNAKKLAMSQRLGAGKPFLRTTMQDISELGTGIHLYFMFTKYMGGCFCLMSILALPSLIMNASGHGFETDMIDPLRFSTLCIANLGVNSTMNATTDWCLDNPFTDDPNYVSYITTAFDILFSLAFVGFIMFFKVKIQAAVAQQAENVTPAKYAVFVRGLPRTATEAEIVAHFNDLYNPENEYMELPLYFGCWGKRKPAAGRRHLTTGGRFSKPVASLDHVNGNELYMGKWIAEVSISRPSGGLLRTFLAMDYLTAKAAELHDILDTYKGNKSTELAIPRIEKRLKKVQAQLEKKTNRLKVLKAQGGGAYLTQCDSAFVVFNCVESQRRCVCDYRTSTKWYARYFQPKSLRFHGIHRLIVEPAPEPSDIIWENLEVSTRQRRLRRAVTNLIAFLLLLLSCAIISVAQSAQQTFSKQAIPNFCAEAVPAVFLGSYDNITKYQWTLAWDMYPTDTVCPAEGFYIAYSNKVPRTTQPVPAGSNFTQCMDPCVSLDPAVDRSCHTLPCFKPDEVTKHRTCATYAASDILQCYCEPKLATAIKMYGIVEGPRKLYNNQIPCQQYLASYLRKNGAIVLAAGVVIVVNLCLQTILRAFGEFERHTSESERASALVFKLFFAQLLNTGVIVLLVNASWTDVPLPLSLDKIFHGEFPDFVQKWYVAVGVGIATTMLVNSVAPQVAPTLNAFVIAPMSRWLGQRAAITQKQLDELYAGPPFDISLRYPLVLNTVFVTMMYCGGIPVLLPIAAASCLITYCCDKLTLMRLYSIRTAYDEALGKLAFSMLPFALLLHLGFSTWMYGNNQFLRSNLLDVTWVLTSLGLNHGNAVTDVNEIYESFRDIVAKYDPLGRHGLASKIFRTNVFPMFAMFVMAACSVFLSQFIRALLWPILDKTVGLVLQLVSLLGASAVASLRKLCLRKQYGASDDGSTIPQYPDFTGYFEKTVPIKAKIDREKGFERVPATGVLIRKWLVHTATRDAGDRMLTWEAFTAPVKTYNIEANPKYKNAVVEMQQAAKRMHVELVEKSATAVPRRNPATVSPM
ncbi:hypothetical protein H310_04271 [Aphanomyces invadans]|uniref:CSC1/OSCA1-like cytosolic domain-containing protein n=1 Tax=Aphanomyces invadans TaxID=157072 RepID=A0A024UGA5_9STRA|nr:hypothetical protein H310_04271 [Aphanomyces invadans]ETW05319.1 hypothetical protein H310_04271 [Aphanomyces invadans]|eukprot:XP_008866757.1 hypothetical protein H310_04271 [Aphanomyces invadans]